MCIAMLSLLRRLLLSVAAAAAECVVFQGPQLARVLRVRMQQLQRRPQRAATRQEQQQRRCGVCVCACVCVAAAAGRRRGVRKACCS